MLDNGTHLAIAYEAMEQLNDLRDLKNTPPRKRKFWLRRLIANLKPEAIEQPSTTDAPCCDMHQPRALA